MSDRRSDSANLFKKIYSSAYNDNNRYVLPNVVKGNKDTVQRLRLLRKLPVHNGCVNTISWSEKGDYVLSGSDDQRLCITNGYTYKNLATIHTGHRANIFSAKFLPNCSDKQVVSCSGDGIIMYTHVDRPEDCLGNSFNCHFGTAYKIVTVPNDANIFMSCGEDGTVRWYDLRVKQSCHVDDCRQDILINCRKAVTALAVNPITPYQLAVGSADSYVQIYDRRMMGTRSTGNFHHGSHGALTRFTVPSFETRPHRITSLVYSSDATEMLVSYSSEYLYLFRLKDTQPEQLGEFSTNPDDMRAKAGSIPPPMKRLRLRGDWSDTGPNARPERELQESSQRPSLHTSLMQRMSDVLTRMLSEPSRNRRRGANEANNNDPVASTIPEEVNVLGGLVEDSSNDSRLGSADPGPSSPVQDSSLSFHQQETEPVILITPVHEMLSQDSSSVPESISPVGHSSLSSEDTVAVPETGPCTLVEPPSTTVSDAESRTAFSAEAREKTPPHSCESVAKDADIQPSDVLVTDGDVGGKSQCSDSSVPVVAAAASCTRSDEDDLCAAASLPDATPPPGQKVLQESLHSLEKELSSRRKHFLERHNIEPVISLHYSAQGSSSGLISMGMGRTPLSPDLPGPVDETNGQGDCKEVPTNPAADPVASTSKTGCCDCKSEANPSSKMDLTSEPTLSANAAVAKGEVGSGEPLVNDKDETQTGRLATGASADDSASPYEFSDMPSPVVPDESIETDDSSESNFSTDDDEPHLWRSSSASRETVSAISQSSRMSGGEILHSADEIVVSPSDDSDTSHEKTYSLMPPPRLMHKYMGHRNARTMIKEANFWGENFIMSGSDCGHIFFWDRRTTEVVMIVEADRHVVNCIQPHPYDPILASSGIDYDIKLWAPLHEEPSFDEKMAAEIMRRNEVMLEETRDTITVPASFMIRMLASLNHLRTASSRSRSSRSDQPSDN